MKRKDFWAWLDKRNAVTSMSFHASGGVGWNTVIVFYHCGHVTTQAVVSKHCELNTAIEYVAKYQLWLKQWRARQ